MSSARRHSGTPWPSARHPGLRRYLQAFFTLPFQEEPGSKAILKGLDVVCKLDAGMQKTFS
jgi:hypothetical protein